MRTGFPSLVITSGCASCEDIKADIPKMKAAFEDEPMLDGKSLYHEEER